MGQVTDKSHGVRQGHGALRFAQIQLARGGVQGRKQLVSGISPGFHQSIEQGGFARVGIANQ
jgi:hypothetical protein